MLVGQMVITSWNENTGEPRVWKLTRAVRRRAGGKAPSHWYLASCLSYYNLNIPLPDHSSLTRIRTRYGLEVFRRFFEAIVEQCCQARLVWGRELYVDATKVEANASMDSVHTRFAVEAHLRRLFGSEPAAATPAEPRAAESAPQPLPVPLTASEQETLAAANAQRHDWIARAGAPNREEVRGSYRRIADFRVSTTDPDATMMPTKGQGLHLGYHLHYVVDGGKKRVILGVLVTPSEVMENQPMLDLLWRAQFRWKLRPHQVTGDTTYGTLEIIRAVEEAHISAYMPLADPGDRNPMLGLSQFRYDSERDVYLCPQENVLAYHYTRHAMHLRVYRADAATCNRCPLKASCTTSAHGRTIHRSLDEHYLARVRAYHHTEAFAKAMGKRKVWIEPLFGEAKQWHGLRRFRLRRLWRVNCEALVTASGQNIKRLLLQRGWGRRPIPGGTAGQIFVPRTEDGWRPNSKGVPVRRHRKSA